MASGPCHFHFPVNFIHLEKKVVFCLVVGGVGFTPPYTLSGPTTKKKLSTYMIYGPKNMITKKFMEFEFFSALLFKLTWSLGNQLIKKNIHKSKIVVPLFSPVVYSLYLLINWMGESKYKMCLIVSRKPRPQSRCKIVWCNPVLNELNLCIINICEICSTNT